MTTLAYTVPQAGTDLNSVADPEIASALNTIKTWANGNLDAVNLSALLAQSAGVNQNAQVAKGVSNIATSESRTNVAFGTLTTPDQVTGIVLPTNGLIAVWYEATWQASVASFAGSAAIFLGANQLQTIAGATSTAPTVQSATTPNLANIASPLGTFYGGLNSGNQTSNYTGDVTTGQVVGPSQGGGPCHIFAAAGTYTVSIQFKASSGSVTVSNRKLWVQALSFA